MVLGTEARKRYGIRAPGASRPTARCSVRNRQGWLLFTTTAKMTGSRHLSSGNFTRHQLCFLLLLGILAGCGGIGTCSTVASPTRTSPKAKRIILTFDGLETEEGRLEYSGGVRDDGYACWLFPSTFSAAACLQVGVINSKTPSRRLRGSALKSKPQHAVN